MKGEDGKYTSMVVTAVRKKGGDLEYKYQPARIEEDTRAHWKGRKNMVKYGDESGWHTCNLVYGDESWIPKNFDKAGKQEALLGGYDSHGVDASFSMGSMTREGQRGYVDVEEMHAGAARPPSAPQQSSSDAGTAGTEAGAKGGGD